MKRYGIVSYNIHGNYTNYGSILQSYALQTAVKKLFPSLYETVIIDYWPEKIVGKDPLNPLKSELNATKEFKMMVEESMPAIVENYSKINNFIKTHYIFSKNTYTSTNFDDSLREERLDGYIVGSDAIWMVDFFGYDKGFWGSFDSMKLSRTIAYAASFGESVFNTDNLEYLKNNVLNFKAIGLREPKYIEFIKDCTKINVERVVDPTLLLDVADYKSITVDRLIEQPYILIYSRKYNPKMIDFADALAEKYGFKVVEISLRAQNSNKHIMFYHAGIEEFLSLIKYSENIVTNSLHATIFATLFHKPVSFFARENAGYKVNEFLKLCNLNIMSVDENSIPEIKDKGVDYDKVDYLLNQNRQKSIDFLKDALHF